MGLFSRSKPAPTAARKPGPAPQAPARPRGPEPLPNTSLDHSRKVIDGLIDGLGHDQAMRRAIQVLLFTTDCETKDMVYAVRRGVPAEEMYARPWRWMASIAERANAEGEPDIAASAFNFVYHWTTEVEPGMTAQDRFGIGIGQVPKDVLTSLAREGRTAADSSELPPKVADWLRGLADQVAGS